MRVLLWESSAYGRAGGRELRPNLHPGRPSLTSVAAESLLASLSLGFPIWTGTQNSDRLGAPGEMQGMRQGLAHAQIQGTPNRNTRPVAVVSPGPCPFCDPAARLVRASGPGHLPHLGCAQDRFQSAVLGLEC